MFGLNNYWNPFGWQTLALSGPVPQSTASLAVDYSIISITSWEQTWVFYHKNITCICRDCQPMKLNLRLTLLFPTRITNSLWLHWPDFQLYSSHFISVETKHCFGHLLYYLTGPDAFEKIKQTFLSHLFPQFSSYQESNLPLTKHLKP